MGAKLIVVSAPPSSGAGADPDQDSFKFFECAFGESLSGAYIVLSPTQIYAVCFDCDGLEDAEFLRSFADEAKERVGVDFVVKDKGSGRTLREALVEMANGFRHPPSPETKEKEKVAVGFIGEAAPVEEPTRWMEWKDVTDAFCGLAGFK